MSKITMRLGGLDASEFLVTDLPLPIQETAAIAMVQDAVAQAAAERKAVAIIGAKGTGKSLSLVRVKENFNDFEQSMQKEDGKYEPRRFIIIQSPRATKHLDVYAAIWKAVMGTTAPVRRKGRSKPAEELRDELVELLLAGNIAVLAFDEVENLSDEGLTVIRDLMSVAESTSKERYAGDSYTPAGVGVVLTGTKELEPRLQEWNEMGHRVLRVVRLDELEADEVADLYLAFLPGFETHIAGLGKNKWVDWIRQEVTAGRSIPIRAVENHVRGYVRRMLDNDDDGVIKKVVDITFNEEYFLFTLGESPLVERRRRHQR